MNAHLICPVNGEEDADEEDGEKEDEEGLIEEATI